MDGPSTRWVIVDDTSSAINYVGGSWVSDVGSWDSVGSFGMPYLSTQHATSTNAKFTFDFTGSAVAVVGSNVGSRNIYWTCSVDGVALESTANSPICTSPCSNSLLCNATALDDGHHTLTVDATPTGNQTFWFDRVEYVPSQQVSREQKAIRVTSWDPELIGRSKIFNFYGVSISWYGSISALFDGTAFNLSWSMDQGDANYTWDWKANSVSKELYPLLNQKFFETPKYPMGMHTLRVSDSVDFRYLIVQNGSVLPSTTSEISDPSTTDTLVAKSGIPGRIVGGIVAGGVVGGLLVFGIVALIFCLCRRRLNSRRRVESYLDKPFFDEKIAHSPNSLQSYPVQRKSRLFSIHTPFLAYTPNYPPSVRGSHIRVQTKLINEPSTSASTPTSGTSGSSPNDHQPMPSIVRRDIAVDVGQANSQLHGQTLVTLDQTVVVHLPPEYTAD